MVDEVAERIRSISGFSIATLEEFLKYSRLREQPGQYPDAHGMISKLLTDHETFIRNLRVDL